MRYVVAYVGAQQPETQIEQRCGAHTVDVVVAVDHDAAAGSNRGHDAIRGRREPRQFFGIAEAGELRVKKLASQARIVNASAGQ